MARSIGSTNFKLVSEYDNSGIKLAMKDMDDSKRMIDGMSKFGGTTSDPMIDKLSDFSRAQVAATADAEAALKKSSLAAAAEQERVAAADKAYWLERARMRDKDLKDQIQADNIAATSKANAVKEEMSAQAKKTASIIAQVREQQAAVNAMNRLMPDVPAAGVAGRTTAGGSLDPRNLQQVGYMIQDFSSQFNNAKTSAEGFARGMGAISNNIQMLGAGLSPMTQAMFAIGGAAAGIIVPAVVNWLADTKAIEEKNKAIEASFERMGPLISGLKQGHLFGAGGLSEAEKAKGAIDSLTDRITAAGRTSNAIRNKIMEEQAGANRDTEIKALQKQQTEITAEINKAEMERAGLQEVWTAVKLQNALKAIEDEKAAKKAAATIEQDNDRAFDEAKRQQAEELRAEDEKIRRRFDVQQAGLRNQIEDLQNSGSLTPNDPSAASIAGSSAAASAINRALSGTRSEEADRKQQIKVLEEQLRTLNRLEQKMNFKRAGLSA